MSAVPKTSPESSSDPFNGAAPPYGDDPTNRLIEAARRDKIDDMKKAMADGARPAAHGSRGDNVYTAAAKGNALLAIDYTASELPAWIDVPDGRGRTGLYAAVESVHPHAALSFLKYGANPISFGKSGLTVRDGFRALVEALEQDQAVDQAGVINETWQPVVAGMINTLFDPNHPETWPGDFVWMMHIPDELKTLRLGEYGQTVTELYQSNLARIPAAKPVVSYTPEAL